MDRKDILNWLLSSVEATLQELGPLADQVRDAHVGGEPRLQGRIDFSNYCGKECLFCSQAVNSWGTKRYRMELPEIIACGVQAKSMGCESIILRAGLDPALDTGFVTKLTRWIKEETGLPLTLSLGDRSPAELFAWKRAGADRYLLPLVTTDRVLFRHIHPPNLKSLRGRIELLRRMRKMGYALGGGIRVGLPGQTWAALTQELLAIRGMGFDFIEVGPFHSRLTAGTGSDGRHALMAPPDLQVPNDELTASKVCALARLLCPQAKVLGPPRNPVYGGRKTVPTGVAYGVNAVIMNLTPRRFWARFQKSIEHVNLSPSPLICNEIDFPFAIGH